MKYSFLFLFALFIYYHVLFMEEYKKISNQEILEKNLHTSLCFDLLAIARFVQKRNEWPGSKSLESANIERQIGVILFFLFVWNTCRKWERELPFTEHQSLFYAIFMWIPQGGCDEHLLFTETIKIVRNQVWRSQAFNLGLKPMPVLLEYFSLVMGV